MQVVPIRCDAPEQSVVGGADRRELKSTNFKVEVRVDACNRYQTLHRWHVYNDSCDVCTRVTLPPSMADTSPTLTFSQRHLDHFTYGFYCLRLTSSFDQLPVETSIDVRLEIYASRLVAMIDGGDSRAVTNEDAIEIDGSTSYDPDLPSYVNQHLQYTWFCAANSNVSLAAMTMRVLYDGSIYARNGIIGLLLCDSMVVAR